MEAEAIRFKNQIEIQAQQECFKILIDATDKIVHEKSEALSEFAVLQIQMNEIMKKCIAQQNVIEEQQHMISKLNSQLEKTTDLQKLSAASAVPPAPTMPPPYPDNAAPSVAMSSSCPAASAFGTNLSQAGQNAHDYNGVRNPNISYSFGQNYTDLSIIRASPLRLRHGNSRIGRKW